jgi:arylsulfatase A-like enzyme
MLVLCFALAGVSLRAQIPARPNVLFIYIDDMNYDLGCFGHPVVQTPNLNALAQRSVRFREAYCAYPVCAASRAATLLGLRPSTTGFVNNEPRVLLDTEFNGVPILPKRFRDAGYSTGGTGKIFHAN